MSMMETSLDLVERLAAAPEEGSRAGFGLLRDRARAALAGPGGGLPTKKMEEWRQTDVAALAQWRFERGPAVEARGASGAARRLRDQYTLGAQASAEIVLVNGVMVPELSRVEALPGGLHWVRLGDAGAEKIEFVHAALGRYAQPDTAPVNGAGGGGFVAINTLGFRDGVALQVAAGAVLERPVHVLWLTVTEDGVAPATHPRVLLVVEAGARGALVETFAGPEDSGYLTNAVTEILVGQEAYLETCRLQQEGRQAWHIATVQAHLERGATLISDAATLGAGLARTDLNVVLAGARATATLNGLVMIGGKQHADNHTLLDHAAEGCPSQELYKHVLSDDASGVFKGKILVRPGAQKTDAKQTSKTLLLSDGAVIDSQPALEIYADDVKCTHGTTTGPVDEEMVFYLRSRGIALEAARHLLTYAFAADITRRIRVLPVRERLETIMAQAHDLPLDLRISADGK
jgi:Fe-S cluster assembly protein SufD